tara:strand:+ start:654 stop:1658 length:1005 start_codon:yes stop_codon:yes gene_type:complete
MIRYGQIGLNYGLKVHIPAFSSDERFKLVGVCSNSLTKALNVKKDLDLELATDNAEDLFSKVDAISIAIPPKQQSIILPKAIKKGLHVFFEKPIGYLPKNNFEIKENQSLMPDLEFLEVDVWKELKKAIYSKEIGNLLHAEVVWNVETYAVSNKTDSWKTNRDLSGGVLNNFASHCFYYLEELMGEIKNLDVKAMSYSSNAEEVVYIYLKFLSGASASISISSNSYKGSGHFLEFTGDKGTARLKNSSNSILSNFVLEILTKSGKSSKKVSNIQLNNESDDRIPAVSSLVNKFGDWIEKKELQKPDINSAVRVQKLLEFSKKSISKEQEISIKN